MDGDDIVTPKAPEDQSTTKRLEQSTDETSKTKTIAVTENLPPQHTLEVSQNFGDNLPPGHSSDQNSGQTLESLNRSSEDIELKWDDSDDKLTPELDETAETALLVSGPVTTEAVDKEMVDTSVINDEKLPEDSNFTVKPNSSSIEEDVSKISNLHETISCENECKKLETTIDEHPCEDPNDCLTDPEIMDVDISNNHSKEERVSCDNVVNDCKNVDSNLFEKLFEESEEIDLSNQDITLSEDEHENEHSTELSVAQDIIQHDICGKPEDNTSGAKFVPDSVAKKQDKSQVVTTVTDSNNDEDSITHSEDVTEPVQMDEESDKTIAPAIMLQLPAAMLAESAETQPEAEMTSQTNLSDDQKAALNKSFDKETLDEDDTETGLDQQQETVETQEPLPITSKTIKEDTAIASTSKDTKTSTNVAALPSIAKDTPETSMEGSAVPSTSEDNPKTNVEKDATPSTSSEVQKDLAETETEDVIPSSAQESMMEAPEMSDSLGLLTESAPRVVEEDEEPDEDDDGDDDEDMDDDKEMDFDDGSNQLPEGHSEDSNPAASDQESLKDPTKEVKDRGGKETPAEPAASASETEIPIAEGFEVSETNIPSVGLPLKVDTQSLEANILLEAKTDETQTEGGNSEAATEANLMLKKMLLKEPKPPSVPQAIASEAQNIINMIELEGSSSEDDVQVIKNDGDDGQSAPKDPSEGHDAMDSKVEGTAGEAKETTVSEEMGQDTSATITPQETDDGDAAKILDVESKDSATLDKIKDLPSKSEKKTTKDDSQVFNLDSDDEQSRTKNVTRCANPECGAPCPPGRADSRARRYYELPRRRALCAPCRAPVDLRAQSLMRGVRELRPLLALDMETRARDLVEISDSESGSDDDAADSAEPLGRAAAALLEANLADMINAAWREYRLDDRLQATKQELEAQVDALTKDSLEIDSLLSQCQRETDAVRDSLYRTFARPTRALPPLEIFDTPHVQYMLTLPDEQAEGAPEVRRSKRPRPSAGDERSAKRTPGDVVYDDAKIEDDTHDISVVALSREAPPPALPPAGDLTLPPLRPRCAVFAATNAAGAWSRAAVVEVVQAANQNCFTICKVRFEHRTKNPVVQVSARSLAAAEPANARMPIGTRIIALFSDMSDATKRKNYYSGIVAEMPNPVNGYRYLVFFDDGYAQYVSHADTRPVLECSKLVWEEVHALSRDFVKEYLTQYPERPMVRLRTGQTLKTEWNGKWWTTRVTQVDASLAQLHFEADNRTEWIYRGSSRLAPLYRELRAAERSRARVLPRPGGKPAEQLFNVPYVEYTRSDEARQAEAREELRRQRAVAKKSTTAAAAPAPAPYRPTPDAVMSRVVYYTPKSVVKPLKMVPHACSTRCRRADALPLNELRTYNPLARPLLSGWERHIVRYKGRKEVMYRAPCGRRLRTMDELHNYLTMTHSEMSVDLFDLAPTTHCLAEFVLNKCIVSKKDLSHGKENVPVPCVNYYDTSLPEFCSYNTERTPTAGVPLNTDPEFLCGCDCEDDCRDRDKCACWRLTLSGARTVGLDGDVGYRHRRLPDPVPSGIYECNERCKCKRTCLNRVAQNPLQLKLQVFKTQNRGWGIRALNDIPKGMFICVYAGNLLTDATANLDGLNEGDEYLAELDYIEVVEQMKEGYEDDVPDKDKALDKKDESSSEDGMESPESEDERKQDDDGDFKPAYEPGTTTGIKKSLRKRAKKKETEDDKPTEQIKKEDDCITISDDEEVREPSRFTAAAGMGEDDFKSKYRSVRSYFGKDEACYIMDAKVQGNIGRYLNHSCTPNVFVQNVFVDTHDPRFPWVAFFALAHVGAGAELTWNYNYDVGSVPGKILHCYCGAVNCRGRLL